MPTTTTRQPALPGEPEYQTYDIPQPPEQPQPTVTAPAPAQIQDRSVDAPRYGFGKGATGALGTAAFLATNVLRGYAQGKAAVQARQAMVMKRTADGLWQAYDLTARNYYSQYEAALEAGKDPDKDPGVQAAQAGRDASWAAWYKFHAGMVGGQEKGKRKKNGQAGQAGQAGQPGGPQAQQGPSMEDLKSPDPQVRAQAIAEFLKRAGPPDEVRIRALKSQRSRAESQWATGAEQNRARQEQLRSKLADLDQQDTASMSPEDRQKHEAEVTRTRDAIAALGGTAGAAVGAKRVDRYVSATDGKLHDIYQDPDGTQREQISLEPVARPGGHQRYGWTKVGNRVASVELDERNQIKPGTENYDIVPPAYMLSHLREGIYHYADAENKIHEVRQTTQTTPVIPGHAAGAGAGAGTGGAGADVAHPGAPAPTAPTVKPSAGHPAAPDRRQITPDRRQAVDRRQPSDRIIGDKGPTGQTKSRADAAASVIPLVGQMRKLIADPEVRSSLGVLPGSIAEAERSLGNLPKKVREAYGTLKSIYSLGGTMHGWRSIKVADEFEKAYGGLRANPESLLGGMDAMENTAMTVYEVGYHKPYAPSGTGAPMHPHEVDRILDDVFGKPQAPAPK